MIKILLHFLTLFLPKVSHGEPINPTEQHLPQSQFLPKIHNNHIFSLEDFQCEHPVIVKIIKGHYIFHALNFTSSVPTIDVQQLWNTLTFILVPDGQDYFERRFEYYTVQFTLRRFHSLLRLRGRRHDFSGHDHFEYNI